MGWSGWVVDWCGALSGLSVSHHLFSLLPSLHEPWGWSTCLWHTAVLRHGWRLSCQHSRWVPSKFRMEFDEDLQERDKASKLEKKKQRINPSICEIALVNGCGRGGKMSAASLKTCHSRSGGGWQLSPLERNTKGERFGEWLYASLSNKASLIQWAGKRDYTEITVLQHCKGNSSKGIIINFIENFERVTHFTA